MENVGAQGQQADRRFVLCASLAALAGAILLLLFSRAEQLEDRAYDYCFKAAHFFSTREKSAPQIGLVAIDDRSVDPDYSPYSSKYGDDGWRTRDLWDLHLKQMGEIYLPKVLAYDILFNPVSSNDVKDQKNVEVMRSLETNGNKEFLNTLIDFDDARSQGLPAPRALFAYYFPDNIEGDAHLLAVEQAKQKYWFKKLERFRLPPGSIAPGGKNQIFHSVRLPMDEILSAPSYYLGAINIISDADGIYRRAPMIYGYQPPGSLEVCYVPGFALEAFLLWLDIEPQDLKSPGSGLPCLTAQPNGDLKIRTKQGEWTMPIDDQFRMTIVPRFKFQSVASTLPEPKPVEGPDSKITITPELFQRSFADLLQYGTVKAQADQVAPETNGKILVVGVAYTGGADLGDFPLERGAPKALMHLNILNNILQNDHVEKISFFVKALICAALAAIMAWLYTWAPIRLAGLWSIALIICYPVVVAVALISRNIELPLIAPSFVSMFCYGVNTYHIYQLTRRSREAMRRLFSSVTSPRVLRLLEENPAAFYEHRKTSATMLFSDVEGFTSLSEKLDPGYLAALMNRYLSPMTEVIVRHDGYLVQYTGDGIMAVWGMPLPDAEHEYKACVAALEHIQAAEALLETLPDGKPYRFRVRIGVNTGTVSAGNMGSAQKLQYTVIGDDVNLTARLEPTNKDYGTQIILGPKTFEAAKDRIWARKLDKIIVKGKKEAVLIYELLGLTKAPAPGEWLAAYEEGMECLWHRQWDEAEHLFDKAIRLRGGDSPSELQLQRIRHYRKNPPAANWQGEFTRLAKD